ncbi:MAG: ATP-dependent helicase HrpB [Kiritimatiellae bacterium]|nr:ATP-dependent helicase HrpB [Kiritimatiellia bacterium]
MFPVEEKLGEIRRALAANKSVVLTAPPGSGKTTCVPPALLGEPWLAGRRIVMLEPRRLAARNCAAYIARTLGEPTGATVGYQVRLERKIGPSTRLEIVTEGLLTQRLLSDPELKGIGLVIFDEFHERSLACDTSFALALETRRALRDDMRIMVMSATLDADEVSAHMGDAVTVHAEGRMFPVETKYLGDVAMSAAVSRALKETEGDVLCFLPGEGEIRRTADALAEMRARGGQALPPADVLPLYGSLPKEEQDRVFDPSSRRKVILATSIAETSLTIPGITCVVDSGLMRVPRFSPATGMSGLVTLPLSRDRAEQRRGRAGRVRAGVCYRLWDEGMDAARPPRMTPEMLDADLAPLVMTSAAWGATRRTDLPWMTPPPAAAWDQASALLRMLGALDGDGRLTAKGERMSKLPMHPRLANMMMGAGGGGRARETAALLAAIVEEGGRSRETDVRKIMDEVRETPNRPFSKRILKLAGGWMSGRAGAAGEGSGSTASEGALLALAYPDRVAKNRGNGTFRMVSGRGAALEQSDPLSKSPYLVCCELDDRQGDAKVFLGCPIGEDEMEALFGDRIVEEPYCEWDRREERVKSVVRRKLGEMVMGERQSTASDGAAVASALLAGIRQKGVENLPCWTKETLQLRARIDFLARRCGWPAADDAAVLSALAGFVGGMSKWRDLERLDMARVFDFILAEAGHDRRELDRLAPARMEVPSGSHMLIRYEGDEPTCEVRLQECFGLMDTPKVAGGQVPVVMTLLSPAQRPVQVTKDLAGFWREGYQLVRKDMRGRYPKHYWPEDPFTAVATRRVRPRS